MKSNSFVIAAAVAVIGCGCVACGTNPVSGGNDGSAVSQKDTGAGDQTIGQTDNASADDGASNTDVTSVDGLTPDTKTDTTKETAGPLCPPEGKPERTVEFPAKDGQTCGTFLEQKFAEAVGGGKEWEAVDCKTFSDKKDCEAVSELYSLNYTPTGWPNAPAGATFPGCSYVKVTFPYDKTWTLVEYALVICDENECVAVTPKPAYKDWYGKLTYSFKTKLLTIEWWETVGGGSKPMVFQRKK